MTMKDNMEKILRREFGAVEVIDNSHLHAGHSGNLDGSGGTHFKIIIAQDAVPGKNRMEKHRAIIAALGDIAKEVHSIEIKMD